MRALAFAIALTAVLLGAAAAGSPDARQPVFGSAVMAYGGIVLLLAILASRGSAWETALRWFLNGTLGLAVVVYALPRSFWRALGLTK